MSTVLLFDLDGTLVLTGGAGRRAMEQAIAAVCGSADGLRGMRFGGMTDHRIIRTALRSVGHADGSVEVEQVIEAYLQVLPGEVASSETYRVLPGVLELLQSVERTPGVAVGLGTGNVEDGAVVKLARGGLDRFFAFGGFGSDHEDRTEILRTGAKRGARHLGLAPDACRVVVIGDTPRDVRAAKALGVPCVAVGTGGHSVEELRSEGAAATFDDLRDAAVLNALLEV